MEKLEPNWIAKNIEVDEEKIKDRISRAHYLYYEVSIPKSSGDGKRKISIPDPTLKKIQRLVLKELLYKKVKYPFYIHGGIPKRSIKTNAKNHINQECLVSLDIKNFFPNIHIENIRNELNKIFNSEKLVNDITRITTHNYSLPQGAPTSPFLSNLPMRKVDQYIFNFCKENHLVYTRYFDDIAISGNGAGKFKNKIIEIVEQKGFKIHKIKEQSKNQEQIITGLKVNNGLSVPKSSIEEINKTIRSINKLGMNYFTSTDPIKVMDSLKGKINFVKEISPRLGKKLKKKYNEIEGGLALSSFK